ncbi:MAG: ABC transporter permease [Patescibacteria group bacterium]
MKTKKPNKNLFFLIKKYLSILNFSFREVVYYPQKLQSTVIIVPFRIMVLLAVYTYTFNYVGKTVNGINASIAVWSIAIYYILLFAQFRGIFKTINDEIKRGSIETQLNKPYNYLVYKFWEHLGKGLPSFIISFVIVIPLLLFFTKGLPIDLSIERLFASVILIVGGSLVSAALYILISLPALWIDDAQPFFWVVDKSILIFGGAYIPVALLPQSFQNLANLTPFGAPMFATQMFNPSFIDNWLTLVLIQLCWTIVLFAFVAFLFMKAKERLSVNGG